MLPVKMSSTPSWPGTRLMQARVSKLDGALGTAAVASFDWLSFPLTKSRKLPSMRELLFKVSHNNFIAHHGLRSVLRQTCFGYDDRPGRYAFGNCVHPCNGRGGCQFRNETSDNQRYDTSITVPTNLADGE